MLLVLLLLLLLMHLCCDICFLDALLLSTTDDTGAALAPASLFDNRQRRTVTTYWSDCLPKSSRCTTLLYSFGFTARNHRKKQLVSNKISRVSHGIELFCLRQRRLLLAGLGKRNYFVVFGS